MKPSLPALSPSPVTLLTPTFLSSAGSHFITPKEGVADVEGGDSYKKAMWRKVLPMPTMPTVRARVWWQERVWVQVWCVWARSTQPYRCGRWAHGMGHME